MLDNIPVHSIDIKMAVLLIGKVLVSSRSKVASGIAISKTGANIRKKVQHSKHVVTKK